MKPDPQLHISQNIPSLVDLGNNFLRSKQYASAGHAYAGLLELLVTRYTRAGSASPPIAEQSPDTHQEVIDLGTFSPRLEGWTLTTVYRAEPLLEGCDDIQQQVPTTNVSAVLRGSDGAAPIYLDSSKKRQLSWVLAHIGWTNVAEVRVLYAQHQIMEGTGTTLALDSSKPLHQALTLHPRNSWALAHLGETYRGLGNSWPGNTFSLLVPEHRTRDYVIALLYLRLATNANPRNYWAHAHYGAAVVNVRAFAGVAHVPSEGTCLVALLEQLFPGEPLDNAYNLLTTDAKDSLIVAQQLTGNFYPWAQVYYAATLIFEGLVAPPSV
ncbi:MAG: hypothetical protein KDK70_09830, partial [Myxococcales bacterium]|nr:hypothetical protein [Myxococcales bacterium]